MTINQLRQYRKIKGRLLLLESEITDCKNKREVEYAEKQILFLQNLLCEVEEYINSIEDEFIKEMLKAHYINGKSWTNIAWRMGGGNTKESVRKQCHRYIKKD